MKILLLILALGVFHEHSALAQGYWMDVHASDCRMAANKNGASNWDVGYIFGEDNQDMLGDVTVGSGSSTTIYCPLTFYSGTISGVTAYVWDRSSTANVSCTLYVFDNTGSVQFSQAQATSGSSSTSTMSLSWSPSGVTSPAYGTVACTVPQALSTGTIGPRFSGLSMFEVFP